MSDEVIEGSVRPPRPTDDDAVLAAYREVTGWSDEDVLHYADCHLCDPLEGDLEYYCPDSPCRRHEREQEAARPPRGEPSMSGEITEGPARTDTMETNIMDEHQRVEVRVSITVGDEAIVTTPQHLAGNPLRVPAAIIARDAGLSENELPGRRFTAVQDGDELRDFRLVDNPLV